MSYGTKAPVIVGLAAGLALIVLFSIFFTSRLPFYPVYPISDVKLQENMEKTPEVKALYSRYPEVSVGFNRDDRIRTISFFGYSTVNPNGEGQPPQVSYSMNLWVVAHLVTGEVQEMGLACTIADGSHDPIQNIFLKNIEKEIITGDCLGVPIPDSWYVQPEPYSHRVSIGNKTFDVQYMFSSGIGIVNSMNVNASTIMIALTVETDQATFFQIKLTEALLEQLQIESDLHYCVGNEFVVFVGNSPVDTRFAKDGQDEIITVDVPAGLSSLEIIGENLLPTSRMCP